MHRLVVVCSNTHLRNNVYMATFSVSSGSCTWLWWLMSLVKDVMHFFMRHLRTMVLSNILYCLKWCLTSVLYGSSKHAISVGWYMGIRGILCPKNDILMCFHLFGILVTWLDFKFYYTPTFYCWGIMCWRCSLLASCRRARCACVHIWPSVFLPCWHIHVHQGMHGPCKCTS
jgi:hypothetical protein